MKMGPMKTARERERAANDLGKTGEKRREINTLLEVVLIVFFPV